MIENINNLKKIDDLINSEGSILALYMSGDKYYLGSYLTDKSGTIYYSTDKIDLTDYINSKIKLIDLYKRSEDFIVQRKFRSKQYSILKDDMAQLIKFNDNYFKDIPDSMRNDKLEIK
jgi:hypothetical protein